MEANQIDELPSGNEWQYEPKWDGFRCILFKDGEDVELAGRSESITRYFPEVVEASRSLLPDRIVLDGELVIDLGGSLSFSALQLRLHPAASRIERLARETPARYVLFGQS